MFLPSKRNYLRVRGEYSLSALTLVRLLELPPRARRILNPMHKSLNTQGTTSACAENTRGRGGW